MKVLNFNRIKKNIFLLCCICFLTSQSQQKDSIADALKFQIEKAESDSIKIPLQFKLVEHYSDFNLDTTKSILQNIEKLLNSKKDKSDYYVKQKGNLYQAYSDLENIKDNLDDALFNLQKAIAVREALNDSTGLGRSYSSRARLYLKKSDSANAKKYYHKAIKLQKTHDKPEALANTYLSLGVLLSRQKQKDSAIYYYQKAKEVDTSSITRVTVNTNLGTFYYKEKAYKQATEIFEESVVLLKKMKKYYGLSTTNLNMAAAYAQLKEYDKSIKAIDSAIKYAKIIGKKELLFQQYYTRKNINFRKGDFKAAYEDSKLFKIYSDSLNDVEEAKRFTELELNYKFEKEKELAAAELKSEEAKKKLYFALLLIITISGLILFYLLRKNNRQKLKIAANKIELKKVEKLKADLALANRENELKKIAIENSITEELLNKTLDDIKEIITYDNEQERKLALKSLSVDLLSEKFNQKSSTSLQSYLNDVSLDFKVLLDTHFKVLNPKEKELLCLMKLGLNSTEISKLQNNTIAAIKSLRYRVRKKLGLDSKQDIIAYIDTKNLT